MMPLFRTKVPQPRGQVTREDPPAVDADADTEEEEDDGGVDDMACCCACCRTLTTSRGVTANAVMMDPTDPDTKRGSKSLPSECLGESVVLLLLSLVVVVESVVESVVVWTAVDMEHGAVSIACDVVPTDDADVSEAKLLLLLVGPLEIAPFD